MRTWLGRAQFGFGSLALALLLSCGDGSNDGGEPQEGACAVKYLFTGGTTHPDGPMFCNEGASAESCTPGEPEAIQAFHAGQLCGEVGFEFCCDTGSVSVRLQTREDAEWYDELRYPDAPDEFKCALNEVECYDYFPSQPQG